MGCFVEVGQSRQDDDGDDGDDDGDSDNDDDEELDFWSSDNNIVESATGRRTLPPVYTLYIARYASDRAERAGDRE